MKRYFYATAAAVAAAVLTACSADPAAATDNTLPDSLQQAPADVHDGVLIVKFRPEAADILDSAAAAATRAGGAMTRSGVVSVDEVLAAVETCSVERVFPADVRNEQRTRESELHLWYVVRFDESLPVADVARRLARLGEVSTVVYNRSLKRAYNPRQRPVALSSEALQAARAMRREAATRAAGDAFDDELMPYQWNLVNRGYLYNHDGRISGADPDSYDRFVADGAGRGVVVGADVQVEQAWKMSTGDESIIVAVLDEGVCVDHPDLAESMWVNEGEKEGHEDLDGNGYAGDVHGYNFVRGTGTITTNDAYDVGHGTHVAGVIAARNGNGIGIASIAGGSAAGPGVKIMSCQIFAGQYVGSILDEVRAIKYAADNGAVILQCSWGYMSSAANPFDWGYGVSYADDDDWSASNPIEKDALEYFTHNAGSPNGVIEGGIAIFASGNEYAAAAGYPGAYRDYISVAATAADFTPAIYTNYGPGTTIAAPGGDMDYYGWYKLGATLGEPGCILSTLPFNVSESGYGYMEGTSMACPHVSGVAALGLSYAAKLRRHFTAAEFRELLCSTARDIDEFMTGSKRYDRLASEIGDNVTYEFQLAPYKGQMGAGQVDAAALLRAIEGSGREMTFPNLYIPEGGSVTVAPAIYFENGRSLSYSVTIADRSVASCEVVSAAGSAPKIVFRGLAEGTTRAAVEAGGAQQSFVITVRKGANPAGWM